MFELESQIRKWRGHLRSTGVLSQQDLEELESHLRDSIDDLTSRGMTGEEAFLVAVRRMGDTNALSTEFAKVSTESLWRQLLVPAPDERTRRRERVEDLLVIGLAVFAGALGKIPAVLGMDLAEENALVYAVNASLFTFPSVAIYLIWKRSLLLRFMLLAATVFAGAALLVNLYPSYEPRQTAALVAMHLPIALLLLLAVLYGGAGWRRTGNRLDFVRFAGEVFIYSVLMGLGGAALVAVSVGVFQFVDIDIENFVVNWVVVFGSRGRGRRRVVGNNLAPGRLRCLSKQTGSSGRERPAPAQSGAVDGRLRALSAQTTGVPGHRSVADALSPRVRGLGRSRGHHVPTVLRVQVTGSSSLTACRAS